MEGSMVMTEPISDVVLRGGDTIQIRPLQPGDEAALLECLEHLSESTIHNRFFDLRAPSILLREIVSSVGDGSIVLIAERQGKVVALAQALVNRSKTAAEVAFVVADAFQRTGIATRMLELLASLAMERRIARFSAEVLPANQRMLDVFLESGYSPELSSVDGTVRVSLALDCRDAGAKIAEHNRIAAVASMQSIFSPRSVAVVGASHRRGHLGAEIFRNLVSTGFTGSIHPVNRNGGVIDGYNCSRTVSEIEGQVDLAVVVVPAQEVEAVIDDCIAHHVRAVVLITAGFSETGAEGKEAERRIVEKIRSAGIRMVGPNCMGVLNTDPGVKLHATFTSVFPSAGNVAMSTQSGALGLAILDYAKALDIGFSTFVSVGNKADVSGNDLLQYWGSDPRTDVILMYLESFGNPQRFGRIAPLVARRKPVVAVKSGRSASGARAAASHTGALASSDAIVDALFRQSGIIRTDSLEEMFDVAALLSKQPLPLGTRVGIVTNAGGPAILAADACDAHGLKVAEISEETKSALRAFLPAAASVANPVDMIASASPDQYRQAIQLMLADENVDALLVIYIPVLREHLESVAAVIRAVESEKTIVATFLQGENSGADLGAVPAFPFPERAVTALSRAAAYHLWRERAVGTVPSFPDVDVTALRAIIAKALARGAEWLDAPEVDALLDAVKVDRARSAVCTTAEEARAAAGAIGYPVAMKAVGKEILHKSDVGGVALDLGNREQVIETFEEFSSRLGSQLQAVLVQQMIPKGVEVVVGVSRHADFGHVIAFGSGGTLVEWLDDVALRIHPLSDVDIDDMISETRCSRLLEGFRGAARCDRAKIRELIGRVASLVAICPEISELDLNPIKATPSGAVVVDARVRLGPPATPSRARRVTY